MRTRQILSSFVIESVVEDSAKKSHEEEKSPDCKQKSNANKKVMFITCNVLRHNLVSKRHLEGFIKNSM